MKRLLITLLVIAVSTSSGVALSSANDDSKLSSIVSINWKESEKIGQARFSKFGIHIYDASFWVLLNKVDGSAKNATALSITYARNIKAKRLLSSTRKEWKRLGFGQQYPINAWLKELEKIWPDVTQGDNITAVVSELGDCVFYSNNQEVGRIDDTDFGPAFLDIWLHIDARYSKHRKELLGEAI